MRITWCPWEQTALRANQMAADSRIALAILFALLLALGVVAAIVIRRSTRELRSVAVQLGEGSRRDLQCRRGR